MALITRLTRLLRADLHAVLDRLEEPEILLAQALREMEEAIAADEGSARALAKDQQQLALRRAEIARRLARIRDELDTCLSAAEEGLARTLLRRRLENERLDRLLEGRERELKGRGEELAGQLDARRRRLAEIRAKLRAEAEQVDFREPQTRAATGDDRHTDCSPIRDADVEIALLAEKRRRAS